MSEYGPKGRGTTRGDKGLRCRLQIQHWLATLSGQMVGLMEPDWSLSGSTNQPLDLTEWDKNKISKTVNLFIASRVTEFLRRVCPELINLAALAMLGAFAMVLAISSYPFGDHDTLVLFGWLFILATVGIGVVVFVQINRDRVISMLKGTEPGHFNWDSTFSLQLLLYGVIPILTLLGAQFPHVLTGFFSQSWTTF